MTAIQRPDPGSARDPVAGGVAEERAVLRRVKRFAFGAWGVFACVLLARLNWLGLLGLTCSALVVMINFLWLEDSVVNALQPAPTIKPWKLGLPVVMRFTLFGLVLSVTLYVVRFNTISVLLGLSVIVAGIMAEGVYSVWKAIRSGE